MAHIPKNEVADDADRDCFSTIRVAISPTIPSRYNQGSDEPSNNPVYYGGGLARKGVVAVTFNCRDDVFGYLASSIAEIRRLSTDDLLVGSGDRVSTSDIWWVTALSTMYPLIFKPVLDNYILPEKYIDSLRDKPPNDDQGAYHESEVFYAMDTLYVNSAEHDWLWYDHHVAAIMSSYWVNFAKTGDPNRGGTYPFNNLTHWAPVDGETETVFYARERFGQGPLAPEDRVGFILRYFAHQMPY
ncbi:hypothetical protein BDW62DRAFT_198725 [Aspergillus aurantiobrunneus]